MNVIMTGTSGMIGGLILQQCLNRDDVDMVTTIVRRNSGIKHPKLREVLHKDFLDYSIIYPYLRNQDICFFCIGVYTGQVSKEEFRTITVDYTNAFAQALRSANDHSVFCFLSGQGADRSERSPIMFAKDKGAAENILLNLQFHRTHIFRPGYIYPTIPRKEPNFRYKLFRVLYRPAKLIYPNIGTTSDHLANVMVDVGFNGSDVVTFHNRDIRFYKP